METEPYDLIIIFTKALHIRSAVDSISHLIRQDTLGLTVQNGLGPADILADYIGIEHTIAGVTDFPADLTKPGEVHTRSEGSVRLGDYGDGRHAAKVARIFSSAKLNANVVPDIRVPIWEKVAFNSALNTLSAVTGATVGAIAESTSARAIVEVVVDETVAVAASQGIEISGTRVRASLENAFTHHRSHKASMLDDLEAGRPLEVDYLGVAVAMIAKESGVTAPVVESLSSVVKFISELRTT